MVSKKQKTLPKFLQTKILKKRAKKKTMKKKKNMRYVKGMK